MSKVLTREKTHEPVVYSTRNGLPERVRGQVIGLLNARLADAVDLQTHAKTAHWNVRGEGFFALHKLFDEIAGDVAGYVDLLAERAVQLGGVAEGGARIAASRSQLPPYPMEGSGWRHHVEALSAALAIFGELVRQAIEETARLGDAGTADLFTEISRGTDKWLWFVESHVNETPLAGR
jgi:starvation-inducible DNA-binding protein